MKYCISLYMGYSFILDLFLCCLLIDSRFLALSCQTHFLNDDYEGEVRLMLAGNRIPDKHDPGESPLRGCSGALCSAQGLLMRKRACQGDGPDRGRLSDNVTLKNINLSQKVADNQYLFAT